MAEVPGWDNGLCQDYCQGLGRWFADRLGALDQTRRDFMNTQKSASEATLELLAGKMLPCPFCGSIPEAEAGGILQGFTSDVWVNINCRQIECEARPYVSGNQIVSNWDGNDKPRKVYMSREQAFKVAGEQALNAWNKRPSLPTTTQETL